MKKSFKKFIDDAKSFSLGKEEKAQIRVYLESRLRLESNVDVLPKQSPKYTERVQVELSSFPTKGIRAITRDTKNRLPAVVRKTEENRYKQWLSQFRDLLERELSVGRSAVLGVFAVAVLIGGGSTYAAANALPGDVLYPIKININEKILKLAAFTHESEVALSVDLVGKRLSEAEFLAIENKLTPALAEQISLNFEKHALLAEGMIEELKQSGDTKVVNKIAEEANKLEANLRAHELLLIRLSGDNDENDAAVSRVNYALQSKLNEVTEKRILRDVDDVKIASTTVGLKEATEGKAGAAFNKIEEVSKYYEQKISDVEVKLQTDASERLQSAKNIYSEGEEKNEAGDYHSAFSKFKESMRAAEEAKVLIFVGETLKFKEGMGAVTITSTTSVAKQEQKKNGDDLKATSTAEKVKNKSENESRVNASSTDNNSNVPPGRD